MARDRLRVERQRRDRRRSAPARRRSRSASSTIVRGAAAARGRRAPVHGGVHVRGSRAADAVDRASRARSTSPTGSRQGVDELAAEHARLPAAAVEGALPRALTWRVARRQQGRRARRLDRGSAGGGAAAAAIGCVQQRFGGARRARGAGDRDSLGLVRFALSPPEQRRRRSGRRRRRCSATSCWSRADIDGRARRRSCASRRARSPTCGCASARSSRSAGDTVTAELIRGPEFTGTLPKKLALRAPEGQARGRSSTPSASATFALDAEHRGLGRDHAAAGMRALVYVRAAGRARGRRSSRSSPATRRAIRPSCTIADAGSAARAARPRSACSASTRASASSSRCRARRAWARCGRRSRPATPAFGMLDGQALTLGRIRGANAAAATVLRVSAIPSPPAARRGGRRERGERSSIRSRS